MFVKIQYIWNELWEITAELFHIQKLDMLWE